MQNCGAVILAAGGSSRFGRPKQLLNFGGTTLVRRMVDLARDAACKPVIVVVGEQKNEIAEQLRGGGATLVENENWRAGIGTSIRAGVKKVAADANAGAVVLLLCDQPFVDAKLVRELIALRTRANKPIVACSYDDSLGVPALFDRSCFAALLALQDSSGAKPLILANLARVTELPFSLGKIDIDTEED